MSEGKTYEALAATAQADGYRDVTPSRVHRWVRDRLIPSTGRRVPLGRRGFGTEPSADAEAQLLALCALRSQTKRLDELAVLLRVGGWDIPPSRIRRALEAFAPSPRHSVSAAEREELDWQLGEMASRIAPRVKARFGRRGVIHEQIADAVYPILQRTAGLRGRIRKQDARVIEDLTGLSRARTDAVGDVQKWLQTSPAQGVELAAQLSAGTIQDIVGSATDRDLDEAGRRLKFWLEEAPKVADLFAAGGDPDFAAFHLFASLRPNRAVEGLVLMLFFDRLGLSSQHDELIAAFTEIVGTDAGVLRQREDDR